MDGSLTASGIHVVPDPIRSIDTPSGSGVIIIGIGCICALSAGFGVPGIAVAES